MGGESVRTGEKGKNPKPVWKEEVKKRSQMVLTGWGGVKRVFQKRDL